MEQIFSEQKKRFDNPSIEKVLFSFLTDECVLFNSDKHWWCYWDKSTDKVYDQYGYYLENADFLRSEGLIKQQ